MKSLAVLRLKASLIWIITIVCCLTSVTAPAQAPPPQQSQVQQQGQTFRAPAVPLVTHDPYFSVWSTSDKLTDAWPKHWTGTVHQMWGMARIDGKTYRFIGPGPDERSVRGQVGLETIPPAMTQTSMELTPTRTIYHFEAEGIRLRLAFTSPLLPHNLDVYSRPITYLTWDAQATDNRTHQVALYFDASAQWAVNAPDQQVQWSRYKVGGLDVQRVGTRDQPVLEKYGDNLRIDWGYLYTAVPPQGTHSSVITSFRVARTSFANTGTLPDSDDLRMPRSLNRDQPVLATRFDLGAVGNAPVSRYLMLAYDDVFSIEYFHRRLRPYWRRKNMEIGELLRTAAADYEKLMTASRKFDEEITADLRRTGGDAYARLAVLAYRQTLAAHKLTADYDGTPLYFSKENFSNGSIDTVDVTYPSSPFFLLFNPELLKAQLTPILDYAKSGRWPWPYAPHDLGTYPLANGQTYGGGERSEDDQMPVEESGNMLIMIAALAKTDGNADYALKYWPVLTRWVEYLRDKGLDPENQLSTDDFAGHLAHNTNLSIKAILAVGSYAMLAEMMGKKPEAASYRKLAEEMVSKWVQMADDGTHYRLAFDKPGTWSQKYNLVWDKLLGLKLFPAQVVTKEIAFYKGKQNPFGLPLDNRETYTKLDWIVWTATLTDTPQDFALFIEPLDKFIRETPDRVPLTDWYWTIDGKHRGFQARSVVGGVYVKMLDDGSMWQKWRERSRAGRREEKAVAERAAH